MLPPRALGTGEYVAEMAQRVDFLTASMRVDSRGVGMVSLVGMGGSGKSAVARAFFDEQSHHGTFHREVFLKVGQPADEQPQAERQLVDTQHDLIGQLAKAVGKNAAEALRREGTTREQLTAQIVSMLREAKSLLLVLDDLWTAHQLLVLLGAGIDELPSGSRVLLTTRERDIVRTRNPVDQPMLSNDSAKAVLAWHACNEEVLPAELADSRVVRGALRMCCGLPLAIKMLGGMLSAVPASTVTWQVRAPPD